MSVTVTTTADAAAASSNGECVCVFTFHYLGLDDSVCVPRTAVAAVVRWRPLAVQLGVTTTTSINKWHCRLQWKGIGTWNESALPKCLFCSNRSQHTLEHTDHNLSLDNNVLQLSAAKTVSLDWRAKWPTGDGEEKKRGGKGKKSWQMQMMQSDREREGESGDAADTKRLNGRWRDGEEIMNLKRRCTNRRSNNNSLGRWRCAKLANWHNTLNIDTIWT